MREVIADNWRPVPGKIATAAGSAYRTGEDLWDWLAEESPGFVFTLWERGGRARIAAVLLAPLQPVVWVLWLGGLVAFWVFLNLLWALAMLLVLWVLSGFSFESDPAPATDDDPPVAVEQESRPPSADDCSYADERDLSCR